MKFSESLVRDSFGQLVAYGVTDRRDRLTTAHRVYTGWQSRVVRAPENKKVSRVSFP